MPIMDSHLLLCESQSIAGNSGTSTDSTNIIYIPQVKDHTGTSRDDRPNVSGRLHLNVVVEDEDLAAAADSSVVTIALYADTDDTTVTTDGTVILTKNISVTQTTNYPDGTQVMCIPLPIGTFDQYLQLKSTKATQNLSTGKITAWIGPPIQQGGEHGAL